MTFKITVGDQFGQNELHERGDSAGAETELFLKYRDQVLRKHHISDTQRRRNGFGKGVEIDDVVLSRHRKQCFRRLH